MDNETRARALLQKMTLEEKIGQLSMLAVYRLDEQGVPEYEGLQEALENGLVGAVIQGMRDFKDTIYQMQKTIVEKSRLKIPCSTHTWYPSRQVSRQARTTGFSTCLSARIPTQIFVNLLRLLANKGIPGMRRTKKGRTCIRLFLCGRYAV